MASTTAGRKKLPGLRSSKLLPSFGFRIPAKREKDVESVTVTANIDNSRGSDETNPSFVDSVTVTPFAADIRAVPAVNSQVIAFSPNSSFNFVIGRSSIRPNSPRLITAVELLPVATTLPENSAVPVAEGSQLMFTSP